MLQLSESECEKIVKRATRRENEVKIEKISSENFGDFLGFLGEYYQLKISAQLGEASSEFQFFSKSLPIKDLRSRRSLLISSGIFLKEVKIYEEIFSEFSKIDRDEDFWRPKTFLLRDDLLVFDDLSLKNFKVLDDKTNELNQKQIEAVLKTLANFHACSLIYERNNQISIGEKFKEILFETSVKDHPWYLAGLDTILKIALKKNFIQPSESEMFFEHLFSTIEIMENSPFNIPHILCHRDLWKNNLMFSKNSDHCVLIDFQTARYLPLSVDVAMAIVVNSHQHEEMMEYYVNYYHACLSDKLRKFDIEIDSIMSKESLLKNCEYHRKYALVNKAIIEMLTKPSKEFFVGFSEDNYHEFDDGDRSRLVLMFMERDANYDKALSKTVKKIVDMFL